MPLNRRDGARQEFFAVACENVLAGCRLPQRVEIHEPHDAAMRLSERHREFAEILVEGDHYPRFAVRDILNLRIAGIGVPVARPNHVVPRRRERRTRTRRDAGVDEDLQAAESTNAGSTRSRPTNRRAKTRQARISSASRYG